jgi:hypothetical protein
MEGEKEEYGLVRLLTLLKVLLLLIKLLLISPPLPKIVGLTKEGLTGGKFLEYKLVGLNE